MFNAEAAEIGNVFGFGVCVEFAVQIAEVEDIVRHNPNLFGHFVCVWCVGRVDIIK